MRNFIQDLRYGIRMMAKRPGFTLIAALTLALGIGANTAIFSAVNAVLLTPLPFPESHQLVDLSEIFKPNGWGSVSVPNFEDWKNQNTVFTSISAYSSTSFNLEGRDTPQRIPGINVGTNYFDVLGVKPTLGRAFLPGEDVIDSERVVVISDDLWRSNFAANPGIVNQTIPLNGQQYTVVGVMPPELSSLYRTVQMWSPLVFPEKDRLNRDDHKYQVIGRIKSDVTLAQAREQMNTIAQRLEAQYKNGHMLFGVTPTDPLTFVMIVVLLGLVALLACLIPAQRAMRVDPIVVLRSQ